MKNFFSNFKKFISKGNVIDMAVGVIIGGAFGKIVTSLVNDIISPFISILTGEVMLKDLKYIINPAVIDPETAKVITPESAITYGNFIQTIIDFLIIAFSIFVVIQVIAKMQSKLESLKKKDPEPEAAPTTKICTFCKSEISIDATRCAHCTSVLEDK